MPRIIDPISIRSCDMSTIASCRLFTRRQASSGVSGSHAVPRRCCLLRGVDAAVSMNLRGVKVLGRTRFLSGERLDASSAGLVRRRPGSAAPVRVRCAGATELFYPEDEPGSFLGDDESSRQVSVVQWYPGHIARAERMLQQQLKLVDMVVEVRDARIPISTSHSQLPKWIGTRKHLLVLNREDMVSDDDLKLWSAYFQSQRQYCIFTNARVGLGVRKVQKAAEIVGETINAKRTKRGLNPRSVRIAVVGFPNVGKSALINRLVGRRACQSAPKPGVTRQLRWTRIAEGLDMLDSPGVLPPRLSDQAAAARLAICNDIGEAAYTTSLVAAAMLTRFLCLPGRGGEDLRYNLESRYGKAIEDTTPEEYVEWLAIERFKGDVEQAGLRLLGDYRKGYLGQAALELPPDF